MPQRIYPNAPITEAILDIRIRPTVEPTLEKLTDMKVGEESRYPATRKPIMFQFQVSDIQSEPKHSSTSTQVGQTFVSDDGLNVFIARRDGLSVHRLKPYTHWQQFREEGKRLWEKYRNLNPPQAIEMLLVRNINKIGVTSGEELQSLLKVFPAIPPELPQAFANFALTVDLLSKNGTRLVINSGIIPPIGSDTMALLLDITAYKQPPLSGPLDENGIWATLDELRDEKDRAFEACITERVRRSIS